MSVPVPSIWHQATLNALIQRFRLGNLPHALLISGYIGIGKQAMVKQLVNVLLCDTPTSNGDACQQCPACTLLHSNTHPDLHIVAPETAGSEIKIDQIRKLSEKLVFTSQRQGYNIAIIEQAHSMNRFAANSLLKTLEEPTANTFIVLLSDKPSRLLPTIRSRCQRLELHKPNTQQALDWLQKSAANANIETNHQTLAQVLNTTNGAPLVALQLLESGAMAQRHQLINDLQALATGKQNAVNVAATWQEQPLEILYNGLYNILADIIRLHNGASDIQLSNSDLSSALKQLAASINNLQAYRLMDEICDANKRISASLNTQLMLESLFSSWDVNLKLMVH